MEQKKLVCMQCKQEKGYVLKPLQLKGEIKGFECEYNGHKAFCSNCCNELRLDSIEKSNAKALNDAYRKVNGRISQEKIIAIPKMYHIGKRPLSLMLGWGESTFSRYCLGYIPTKPYSAVLEKIYSDPLFYLELLEGNKHNISSNLSYEKTKLAALTLLKQKQKFYNSK